jgi:hypothetical protein
VLYGYARVSSLDQDLSLQLDALTAAGCTVVRSEKVTGTSTDGREELATLLQFLREGDTLVVTRIDRLARSLRDCSRSPATMRHPESNGAADRGRRRASRGRRLAASTPARAGLLR